MAHHLPGDFPHPTEPGGAGYAPITNAQGQLLGWALVNGGSALPVCVTPYSFVYWTGIQYVCLPPGPDGYKLTTHGAGNPPTWEAGVNTLKGFVALGAGVSLINVPLAVVQSDTNYSVSLQLRNTVDVQPPAYAYIVYDKSVNDFDVEFSAPMLTANYVLEWAVFDN